MRWQSSVANKVPVLEWIGLPKRPSVSVFALFFAALLSTVPINAQQVVLKFLTFDSEHEQLNTSLGMAIGVDSVWAAARNNNRIHRSLLVKNNDDQWKSLSVGQGQPALFRIEYFQLPAFASLQVDQICSYCYTLY